MENSLVIRSPYNGQPLAGVNHSGLAGLQAFTEAFAEKHPEVKVTEPEPVSFFCKNLYARWLELPAGAFVIGRIIKEEHMFMLASGTATVIDAQGVHEHTAPWMMVAPAGAQRIIHTQSAVTICTFHPNVAEAPDMKAEMSCATAEEFNQHLKLLTVKKE